MESMNSIKYRWEAIAARMPQDTSIIGAEIGVWRGQMSEKLLKIMPKLSLIMVDWWTPPPPGHSYFEGSLKISRMSAQQLDDARIEAQSRVAQYKDRARIIQLESAIAAENFKDNFFDFVFLDGDHSFDGVTRDLNAWTRTVKPGGYIGGHDWESTTTLQDVKRAAETFLGPEMSKKIELDVNKTWFVKL